MLGLCSTCLSADRNVTLLKNYKKKSMFVDWIDAFSTDYSKTQFCWECHAMFVKIEKFKIQIHNAQSMIKVMEERKINFNYHLSNLSICTINTYDKQYEESDKENNYICGSVTNKGKDSDSSIKQKSLPSNIWNIKDEDNIMCTTDNVEEESISDVDISNISNDGENDINIESNSIHIQEDDDIKINLNSGPNVCLHKENSNIGIDIKVDSNVGSNSVDIQEHDNIESDLNYTENNHNVGYNSIHIQEYDDIKIDLNVGPNTIYTKEDSNIGIDIKANSNVVSNSIDIQEDHDIKPNLKVGSNSHHQEDDDIKTDSNIIRKFIYTIVSDIDIDDIEALDVKKEAPKSKILPSCYVPIVKLTDADLEKFGARKRKTVKEIKDTCKTKLKVKHNEQAQRSDLDKKEINSADEDDDEEDGTDSITSKKPRINHQNTKGIKRFMCATCGHRFQGKSYLTQHELLHSDEKVNYCALCDVSFSHKRNLRAHLLTTKHLESKGEKVPRRPRCIIGNGKYKCLTCGKRFANRDSLRHHTISHTNTKAFYCDICDNSLSDPGSLRKHLQSSLHKTNEQNSKSEHYTILEKKRLIEVDPNKVRIVPLSPEEEVKQREEDIKRDSRKPYRCDICLKGFHRVIPLENHMKTHNPTRGTHKCRVCHMYFRELRGLKRHMLTHTQRYECIVCKKRVTTKSCILEHVSEHYTMTEKRKLIELDPNKIRIVTLSPEEEVKQREEEIKRDSRKPYRCKICFRGFRQIISLRNHKKGHNPSRGPYKCQICHVYFGEHPYLEQHLLSHTQRYECLVCNKRVTTKGCIVEHVRYHQNVKQNYCDICDKSFPYVKTLRSHFQSSKHKAKAQRVIKHENNADKTSAADLE